MTRLAIDFGNTNTVVAVQDRPGEQGRLVALPEISYPKEIFSLPLIPSRLAILADDSIKVGAAIPPEIEAGRLFTSFKRSLGTHPHVISRNINGQSWDEAGAASAFLRTLLTSIRKQIAGPVEELILTAPVSSFENYLQWLHDHLSEIAPDIPRIRVIDECTAAALGYAFRKRGAKVMVFDFGGGTLDISVVRMPESGDSGGLLVGRGSGVIPSHAVEARVLAKAGRIVGGDDIDSTLMEEALANAGRTPDLSDGDLYLLRKEAERAKIHLTDEMTAFMRLPGAFAGEEVAIRRDQLEALLDRRGILSAVRRTIESTLRSARQIGLYPEDIEAVLMIGGSSQIPAIRHLMRIYFDPSVIYSEKNFEAVALGALELASGLGISDILHHSYAIRVLEREGGQHQWEEIIPRGCRYPTEEPVTLVLAASRDQQSAIELVIGEVEEESAKITEVVIGGRGIQTVGKGDVRRIVALNESEESRTLARLDPPGKAGIDRAEVSFSVDAERFLRVTVRDLLTRKILISNKKVIELR